MDKKFWHQLATSLLTTCSRLVVSKLSPVLQEYPDTGLLIKSVARCQTDLLRVASCNLCVFGCVTFFNVNVFIATEEKLRKYESRNIRDDTGFALALLTINLFVFNFLSLGDTISLEEEPFYCIETTFMERRFALDHLFRLVHFRRGIKK